MDCSFNEITNKGLEEICLQFAESRKVTIKTIKLNGNNISDKGGLRLLQAIELNSSQIEEIGLADNGLHEEFGEKLCEFLKVLRTRDYIFYLKKFDLTGNGIAPDGLEAVNKELRKNQLQQLDHDKPRQEKELKVQRIAYKRRHRIAEK